MRAFAVGMIFASAILAVQADAATEQVRGATETSPNRKEDAWLTEMSRRLEDRIPDKDARMMFLRAVLSESKRADVDPQLVLSLIEVASGFKKYAVASGGARGYMQVNPSWPKAIGTPDANLFHTLVNIRYGCTLLQDYIADEKGDVLRALGQYRLQMGGHFEDKNQPAVSQADFPDTVFRLYKTRWRYDGAAAILN